MTEISPASALPEPELMLKSFCDRFVKNRNLDRVGASLPAVTEAGYTPQGIFEETGFEPIQQIRLSWQPKSTRA
jgi:hypothetical protein